VNEGKRVIDHTTAAGERGEARGSGHVITLRLTDTRTEAVKPIVQRAVEKAELVIFTVAPDYNQSGPLWRIQATTLSQRQGRRLRKLLGEP
jgi:hypothetical protein